jgi:hypothetical protein
MDQSRPLVIVTTLFYHWFQTNYPRGNGGTISGVVRGGARSGEGVERLDPHTMMMIERVRGVMFSRSYPVSTTSPLSFNVVLSTHLIYPIYNQYSLVDSLHHSTFLALSIAFSRTIWTSAYNPINPYIGRNLLFAVFLTIHCKFKLPFIPTYHQGEPRRTARRPFIPRASREG